MYLRSLLTASALSLNAAAFLVVPEALPPLEDASLPHIAHTIGAPSDHLEQFQLACDACPFPENESDGVVSWSTDTRSSLELNFYTNDGQLYVNDARVFPVPPTTVDVKAVQRRESDGKETDPLKLGFALVALPVAPPEDGLELMQIRFSPLDIEGHPAPLDTISLAMIKTASGDLFIARTDIEPPAGEDDHESWEQCNGDIRCLRRLVLLRIHALFQSAKAHMMNLKSKILHANKGCHGKPRIAHLKHGHHGEADAGELRHPGHRWGANGHQHPHHRHGWRRTVSRIVRFIVIPAVLGVLAGLTASAIGMLVGQLIVFVWMRYRRSTTSRSTSTLEQGTTSEKYGLMVEDAPEEDLPPYRDEDQPQLPPTDAK
ncbi:hypothetical protein BGW36DRAFT_372851 [Talaromyces proteolyticus]|uniref:DUF7728 domain-containing protein n=1 Tax=Talaromyces proteolyticus TaxID=1131652 RepID=A0AAD4L3A8_9EURO|nr:uncharacterized protein BGW36DRAFT_372851 [Talaromyces proteolyticus]KAH8702434.1 hypothetical protein BGW36DRAFT_372851 [Talaromyces proteolyticus]